jgi:hypothetical protein
LKVNNTRDACFIYCSSICNRGRVVTVLYDSDGTRYNKGTGLMVLLDGKLAATAPTLQKLTVPLE